MKYPIEKVPNILVVDDNEIDHKVIRWWCLSWGYSTDHAYTAVESLEKIKHHEYDLIISDVMLPDMTGFELYRQIRKLSISTRVIFNTSINRSHPALRQFTDCVFLEKPYQPEVFKATIEKIIGKLPVRVSA